MKYYNKTYFFNATVTLLILLFVILSTASVAVGAEKRSTILTAERISEPIVIDGYANESSWAAARILTVPVFDGKVGDVDVTMDALYDDEYIYMHITWPDTT
ncbi:MAG TPA: hypothetical protein ENH51_00125, partial [Euryarchaeota archaeon]|nr:hypothetical protein [Euryarchaeota archaeon]